MNDNLVLLVGKSASGKTASLRDMINPEGVLFLNCEAGKKPPFPAKFQEITITDPMKVFDYFAAVEKENTCHTIVIDSLTYLMDMFESVYVINSGNTMGAWGDYAQYFKKLMQKYVASSTKNVIFTAHTSDSINEATSEMETSVKVKGATNNNGVESYFTVVIACKRMVLTKLEGQESEYLNITPQEEALGFKYVYQTQVTKDTIGDRIRGPIGMWPVEQTFIDNNIEMVFKKFAEYYGGS